MINIESLYYLNEFVHLKSNKEYYTNVSIICIK